MNGRTGSNESQHRERRRLVEALLARTGNALARMAAECSAEELAAALEAPTDVGTMAVLMSGSGAFENVEAIDPWAEFLVRGAQMKQAMLEQAGGALSTGKVAALLGISPQAVQQRARRGTLLALTMGSDERLFPVCQFTEGGVIKGLEKVLAAFNVDDPWTRLAVLLDTGAALGGRRVIDALRNGDLDPVLRIVRSFASD